MSTLFLTLLAIAGVILVVGGLASLVLLVRGMRAGRRARRFPARRPDRRTKASGGVVPAAGRVYASRAAGVAPARDRGRVAAARAASVATLPSARPAWTVSVSHHAQVRAGRHRTHAGVSR